MKDSDSEEEILVYAEFAESVNIDKYRAIHILGAAERKPIIQLDETFFIGKYEKALGTYMFFENDPSIQGRDPLFDKYPDKGVKYVCKTRKLLSMEHAYVTPKEDKESNSQSQAKQIEEDVQPITFRDLQQAIDAFKPYFVSDATKTDDQNLENRKTSESVSTDTKLTNKQNSKDNTVESSKEQNFEELMIDKEQNSENIILKSVLEQNTSNSNLGLNQAMKTQ